MGVKEFRFPNMVILNDDMLEERNKLVQEVIDMVRINGYCYMNQLSELNSNFKACSISLTNNQKPQ
jgi:hypothetical protein